MRKIILIFCILIVSDYCNGSSLSLEIADPDSLIPVNDTLKIDSKKGLFELRFSSPCFNIYQINVDNYGLQSGAGFAGLAAGIDFYHSANQFLSLSINAAMTQDNPFFLFESENFQPGIYQIYTTSYLGLTNNHLLGKVWIGYGLSYSKEDWIWQNIDASYNIETKRRNGHAIGLMFPMNIMLSKSFYIGLVYRPTFIQFSPNMRINYEYLLSYNVGWIYSKNKK